MSSLSLHHEPLAGSGDYTTCLNMHCIALRCIALRCVGLRCIVLYRITSYRIEGEKERRKGGRGFGEGKERNRKDGWKGHRRSDLKEGGWIDGGMEGKENERESDNGMEKGKVRKQNV